MNRVCLIGNLTKAVEVRYTPKGMAMTTFTLAVRRETKKEDGTYDCDFINCVAYRTQAESLGKYLDKGSMISVEGRIQTGSYEKDGRKIYTTDIIVDKIQFLNSKKEG